MTAGASTGERPIVLYAFSGIGHLAPMVELAKVLLRRGFSVEIIILDPPYDSGFPAAFVSRVSAAYPSISFHCLPQVPAHHLRVSAGLAMIFELVRVSNPSLLRHLRSTTAIAIVLDSFCIHALDVAREVGLPAYLFSACGASYLSASLHLPSVHSAINWSFRDLGDSPIHFPGVPPIPASHMPPPWLDREGESYRELLQRSRRLTELDGIVVNTFEALEPEAIRAIRGGLCVPKGARTLPIYCFGPLTAAEEGVAGEEGVACLAWLDAQPQGSVVFLCFGSMGRFSAEQLKEIATGLENSGHRFIWVVRSPPGDDYPPKRVEGPPEDPDLDSLLPAGFLHRTAGRGMVVWSWAPQPAVLAHKAVGGFC